MSEIEKLEKLGKGTYGTVYKKDNEAIKIFKHSKSCIQEVAACVVLSKCENVIKYNSYSIKEKKILYPLYDTDLEKWSKEKHLEKDIMLILKQVVIGLINIHHHHFVHCDLKPQNIFIRKEDENIEAVIGDLGLISVSRYAKTQCCTEFYSEKNQTKYFEHDIYCLGIIFIQLLSNSKLKYSDISTYSKVQKSCMRIRSQNISSVVMKMVDKDKNKRPTAKDIYLQIWGGYTPFCANIRRIFPAEGSLDTLKDIEKVFYDYSIKYSCYRPKKFLKGIQYYILTRKISKEEIEYYVKASFFIMSSIYRQLNDNSYPVYRYLQTEKGELVKDEKGFPIRIDTNEYSTLLPYIENLLQSQSYIKIIMIL